nr:MAG TPA: Heat shock factor binding protein 1 [Bacteriophage sp.]
MEDYAKETKKIQQDVYKAVQKEADNWLANQVKNINELDKEFQKSFDKIQDKIDDTTKNIENLTKNISDLRKKLVELQVEQTQSVAKEYVKAKKELESLEEQYKGLKEVADGVSRADLKGVGGIGKYDVDLIKKYKDYQDEMKSAYSGLSEEERKAMDKQIAYQERYR